MFQFKIPCEEQYVRKQFLKRAVLGCNIQILYNTQRCYNDLKLETFLLDVQRLFSEEQYSSMANKSIKKIC